MESTLYINLQNFPLVNSRSAENFSSVNEKHIYEEIRNYSFALKLPPYGVNPALGKLI